MSKLPQHWIMTSFGNICGGGQYGWTTRAIDKGSVKFLRTTDITKGKINWDSVPYCQENPPDLDKYRIQASDILISRAGSVGFSTLINHVPFPTVFASYLIRFVPSENIEPRYIAYFLRSSDYWQQISEVSSGIALSNVNAKKLSELITPLAPLNEQRRIADKLDALLARVGACRERLDRVSRILQCFRQSVLVTALSGDLTEDWRAENSNIESDSASDWFIRLQERFRENSIRRISNFQEDIISEPTLPDDWLSVPVESVGEVFLGRQRSPKHHSGSNMRPYVRAANITWNGWNFSDVKEMNFDPRDFERYRLQAGDVLVNEGSGSAKEVGKPAIWRGEIEDCCFQNTLICVRPFEKISEYLYLVFLHAALSRAFVEEVRGIGIHHLGKERFSAFLIPLPPIREQQEIVRRVGILFAYADRLEVRHQRAFRQFERLTPAFLATAFCGELVPQDPSDESASMLLERIHIMRANAEATVSQSHRRKPKSDRPLRSQIIMLKRKEIQPSHLSSLLKERGSMAAETLWSASQLEIDDFYDQLKDEEANGLLKEMRAGSTDAPRLLEAL